jgi:hypothetical protein
VYSRWLALADSAPFEVRDCTVQYSTVQYSTVQYTVVFRVRMNRKLLSYHLIFQPPTIQFNFSSVLPFCVTLFVPGREDKEGGGGNIQLER